MCEDQACTVAWTDTRIVKTDFASAIEIDLLGGLETVIYLKIAAGTTKRINIVVGGSDQILTSDPIESSAPTSIEIGCYIALSEEGDQLM